MNFKHVLIVTYGRSGSTLLQGLLNSIDGCLVRGENFNACRGLFMAYDSIRKAKERNGDNAKSLHPTSPWYGAFLLDEKRFLSDARQLLIRQLAPGPLPEQYQCIGFKEVRYLGEIWPRTETAAEELTDYLDFLSLLLPGCALILLSRDHEHVVGSAWWKGRNPVLLKERLTFFEKVLAEYAKGKSWVYSIEYEDIIRKSSRLQAMYEFLGAHYDETIVDDVLGTQHSVSAAPGKPQKRLDRWADAQHPIMAVETTVEASDTENVGNQRLILHMGASIEVEVPSTMKLIMQDPLNKTGIDWASPATEIKEGAGTSSAESPKRLFSRVISLSDGQSTSIHLIDSEDDNYCLAQFGIGTQ